MIDRRTMLKLSFLVPAALALACAPRAKGGGKPSGTPAQAGGAADGTGPDPLAAIRSFKVRPDTEPAFVFAADTRVRR